MKDMIDRTLRAIEVGATPEDIKDMLSRAGLNDYQAWLTYKGAKLIAENESIGE